MDQSNNVFVCFCNTQIPYSMDKMKQHISFCHFYQNASPFFAKFNALPKRKMQHTHLFALKAEFTYFLDQIEDLMVQSMEEETTKCQSCLKSTDNSNILCLTCCFSPICKDCLNGAIQKEYIMNGLVKCPNQICRKQVESDDLQQFLGKEKFDQYQEYIIERMCDIITCIKCQIKAGFEIGSQVNSLKDPSTQKPLIPKYIDHYRNNRFVCINQACKSEQCKQCRAVPYHLGMNCEEYKIKQASKRCRYCDETIPQVNLQRPPALQDICNAQECTEKSKFACQKVLQCGHSCPGMFNEGKCPPCLNEKCSQQLEQKGDDYCNICFVEGLIQAPVLQSICGHMFHYSCMLKRLEVRWNGPRIVFTCCFCPLCSAPLLFQASRPQDLLKQYNLLLDEIKTKSLERLKYEGRDKDDKVAKVGELFYNKFQEYAMAIYCYYQCFKCKKPYFGGAKDCQRGLDDDKKEFDPTELVCANCCEVPAGENCPQHGKEYIEFKCKFCCTVAVWFCWGTTHFCDDCHKRQCSGDYLSKYSIDKLPKCQGADKCPLKIAHKPNGEEFPIGCAICRNAKANIKNF